MSQFLTHQCPTPESVAYDPTKRRICHYVSRDDGVEIDPQEILNWLGDPNDFRQVRYVCGGRYAAGGPLRVPVAYRYQIRGDGADQSIISATNPDGDPEAPAIWLDYWQACEIDGVALYGTGGTYGVQFGGPRSTSDRGKLRWCYLAGHGSLLGGTVFEDGGDHEVYGTLFNYYGEHLSPSVTIKGGGGYLFVGGEMHTHAGGSDVLRLDRTGRLALVMPLISSEPLIHRPLGRSLIGISGRVPAVTLTTALGQSDTPGRTPYYGIYLEDGAVMDAWEINTASSFAGELGIIAGPGTVLDSCRIWPTLVQYPRRHWQEGVVTLRGRVYPGRAYVPGGPLDPETWGCYFVGKPAPNAVRVGFDRPFAPNTLPTVQVSVEAAISGGGLSSPPSVIYGEVTTDGFTVQTHPGDQQVSFTVRGRVR